MSSRRMKTENQTGRNQLGGRVALNLAGRTLWHFPGRFGIARLLGRRCSLRCVLFHDVSDTESSFHKGTGWHDHAQELRGCAEVYYQTLQLPSACKTFLQIPMVKALPSATSAGDFR